MEYLTTKVRQYINFLFLVDTTPRFRLFLDEAGNLIEMTEDGIHCG